MVPNFCNTLYCQLFKMSDVSYVDGSAENYQPQWDCYAKASSNMIVAFVKINLFCNLSFFLKKTSSFNNAHFQLKANREKFKGQNHTKYKKT
eukprot:UN21686